MWYMETEALLWPLRSKSRAIHFDENNFKQGNRLSNQIFHGKNPQHDSDLVVTVPFNFPFERWRMLIKIKKAFVLFFDQLWIHLSSVMCFTSQAVCFVLLRHSTSAVVPFLQTVTRYFRIAFLHTRLWESHLMHPEKIFAARSSFIMTLRWDKHSRFAITSLEVISRESRNRSLLDIYGNLFRFFICKNLLTLCICTSNAP